MVATLLHRCYKASFAEKAPVPAVLKSELTKMCQNVPSPDAGSTAPAAKAAAAAAAAAPQSAEAGAAAGAPAAAAAAPPPAPAVAAAPAVPATLREQVWGA